MLIRYKNAEFDAGFGTVEKVFKEFYRKKSLKDKREANSEFSTF